MATTSPTIIGPQFERANPSCVRAIARTLPVNLAGLPGISLPCGLASAPDAPNRQLPVGLQVIGQPLDEATVLRVAQAYQAATDWHRRRPGLALEAV